MLDQNTRVEVLELCFDFESPVSASFPTEFLRSRINFKSSIKSKLTQFWSKKVKAQSMGRAHQIKPDFDRESQSIGRAQSKHRSSTT